MTRLSIELSGPLFNKPVVARTRRGATSKIITRLTTVARQNVTKRLTKGHGRDSGDYRRSIRKKTKKGIGFVFSTDARKATWLEGTQARQQSGSVRFRGYRVFAEATEETDRDARPEAEKAIAELARALGGR